MGDDRKLATIRKILDLQPIPNADKIEKAIIDGWEVVVKKGEFNIGDLCCYIEIDSIVPSNIDYWSFMTERKYRVKTIKLRGQVSQGLVIPIKDIDKIIIDKEKNHKIFNIGDDVTNLLGITKWLSPSERESDYIVLSNKKYNWFTKYMNRFSWYRKLTNKKISKGFPNWLSKTDEERIQNIPWVLSKYKDDIFYTSEKLDGSSGTFWYLRKGFKNEFGICSRTMRKSEKDNSNWSQIAKSQDIKNKLKNTKKNIAIQGEIIGPKIQKNKYGIKELDFYVFNVYNIDKKEYYNITDLVIFCQINGFKHVPLLDTKFKLPNTIPEIVEISKGKSKLKSDQDREGIVVRTHDKSISFKVINPDYLLKQKDDE